MSDSLVATAITTTSLASFAQFVASLRQQIKRQYDRNVNMDLSRQNSQDLLRRNVTSVLNQAYDDALGRLRQLAFTSEGVQEENGFSQVSIQALKAFDGFVEEILQYALQKHRTSCALSNFPDEHRPSEDYIAQVMQETEKDWQAFGLQVNSIISSNAQ
jgi:hypothetical protein